MLWPGTHHYQKESMWCDQTVPGLSGETDSVCSSAASNHWEKRSLLWSNEPQQKMASSRRNPSILKRGWLRKLLFSAFTAIFLWFFTQRPGLKINLSLLKKTLRHSKQKSTWIRPPLCSLQHGRIQRPQSGEISPREETLEGSRYLTDVWTLAQLLIHQAFIRRGEV